MKQVIVRAYGAKLKQTQENIATNVFKRQNWLWNDLVAIEQDNRTKYREAVEQSDPELSSLVAHSDTEQIILDALLAARSKERLAKRTKNTAEITAKIKESSGKIKVMRTVMKDCKTRAKLAAKPLTDAIELERRAAVKLAMSKAALWWAHSETIIAKYDVARVKAMKEGAELRFNRFDGEGSMGVRLPASGAYTLADIMAGRTSMVSIRAATPDELGHRKAISDSGKRRVIVTLRAGDKSENGYSVLEFLTTLHRDCPTNIPLKIVTARRDMNVNIPEWKLVFTFAQEVQSLPPPSELPSEAAGVDFGWRVVQDGLRVATLRYAEKTEFITLPTGWLERMDKADGLRAELDNMSNDFARVMLPKLKGFDFTKLDEKNQFAILAGKAIRAKGNYAQLLISVCDSHAVGKHLGSDENDYMQQWRQKAVEKAIEANRVKRVAIGHRKHIYRNVASQIVNRCGLIGLEDVKLAGMAELISDDGTDNPLHKTARANRVLASCHELKIAIINAAKREQRELVMVPAANTTRECSDCGHVHDAPIVDLIHICTNCGKVADQDENAAKNCRKYAMNFDKIALELEG